MFSRISSSIHFRCFAFFAALAIGAVLDASEAVRWKLTNNSERLADLFAPSAVSFHGDAIVALGWEGYKPGIKTYFDLETGQQVEELFEGGASLSVVDFSEESGWALVFDEYERLALLDTKGSHADLTYFVGIANAFEVDFFEGGDAVIGISERLQSDDWQVTVVRREESWETAYSKRFPKAWRLELSKDRSSFVVFQVDEVKGVFTKLERYAALSGELLSSLDLTDLEIEATLASSVKSSVSGRYTVIIPEDFPAYLIIDSVDVLGAVRMGLGAFPRVIGFSDDENRYAIAHGKRISIYDTVTGEALLERDVPIEGRLYAGIDFSASGERILLAERRGVVSYIDLENGTSQEFSPGLAELSLVRFDPLEKKAIVGNPAGRYAVLDLAKAVPNLYLTMGRANWAGVAQHSEKIILFSEAGRVREYAVDTLELLGEGDSSHSTVGRIVGVSESSRRVLSERGGLDVRTFDGGEPLWTSVDFGVQYSDFSADGTRVVYVSPVAWGEAGKVKVFDVDSGTILREVTLSSQYVLGAYFSSDARSFWAVENVDGVFSRLRLFDVASGEQLASSQEFSEFLDLVVHPSAGVFVLTYSSVRQFDGVTGELLAKVNFATGTDAPSSLQVSPGGSKVGVSTKDHRLLVFDWHGSRRIIDTSLKSDPISSVRFSESNFDFLNDDGDILVTWWTGRVEVLRMLEGRLVRLRVASDESGMRFGFVVEEAAFYRFEHSQNLQSWVEAGELVPESDEGSWHSEIVQAPEAGVPLFMRVWEYR